MFNPRLPPLTGRKLARRVLRTAGAAALLIALSLALGTGGYHWCGDLAWIDALLNAAMILTGMGPVDPMTTTHGKLFAAFYALFSGVAFLTIVVVLLSPLVHRFLIRYHIEADDNPGKGDR